MDIELLKEAGYGQAMVGLSLPFKQKLENMPKVALKLKERNHGHNKFLEQMIVWLKIKAPLYWWKQFDTYRIGVSKQSESTMHKGLSRILEQDDFAYEVPKNFLNTVNNCIINKDFKQFNNLLPSGYLQERMVMLSYKTIREIIIQRGGHKLKEWDQLINFLYTNLYYSELLPDRLDPTSIEDPISLITIEDTISFIKKLALKSNDPNTQVGAVIEKDSYILGYGFNRMPQGLDAKFSWDRPDKYFSVCHAEIVALFDALKKGQKVEGANLWSTHLPCSDCIKYLADFKINHIYYLNTGNIDSTEQNHCANIAKVCGVQIFKMCQS